MARRLKAMKVNGYENGFELTLLPDRLRQPLERKRPTFYFVNSMSDLFHNGIPFEYIDKVFEVIRQTPQHTYQILTKRAERMAVFFAEKKVPNNAWLGVTVENRHYGLPRIDYLRQVPSRIRFLSMEPLLEDLGQVDLSDIHWVIVGGESGPKARPMRPEWVKKSSCNVRNKKHLSFFSNGVVGGLVGANGPRKQMGGCLMDELGMSSLFCFVINNLISTNLPLSHGVTYCGIEEK